MDSMEAMKAFIEVAGASSFSGAAGRLVSPSRTMMPLRLRRLIDHLARGRASAGAMRCVDA